MLKLLIYSAIALSLSACATTAKYEAKLASWVGSNETDLVRAFGVPEKTFESGGKKFLVYYSGRNVYLPGQPASYTTNVYGNTAYTRQTAGSAGQNIALSCETTFEVSSETVTSWSWRGNDCRSN